MSTPWAVPEAFAAQAADLSAPGHEPGSAWVRRLPTILGRALDQWGLVLEDGAWWGVASLVLPVRRRDGGRAVLKLGWPHAESAHEHLALRAWDGRRAVRLLAALPRDGTLLLERLADRTSHSLPPLEEAEVIAGLLRDLDRPALPQVDGLGPFLEGLLRDLDTWERDHPGRGIPRRLVAEARAAALDLRGDPDLGSRLVHTDLHGGNVMWRPENPARVVHSRSGAATAGDDAGAWVAIDPKPMNAHPAFGIAPVLWNRWDEAMAAHDPRSHLAARFATMVDVLDLDPALARAATTLRLVRNALWTLQDAGPINDVTRQITVIKALDPS